MATYTVTSSNWNSPAFWSGVNQGSAGHTLDFSALGAGYTITYDTDIDAVTINDGSTSFVVGDVNYTGTADATLGGSTVWDYFTTLSFGDASHWIAGGFNGEVITTGSGDDTIYANSGADSVNAGDGNNVVYGGPDADSILSGSGVDNIFAGTGADTVNSGGGDDYVDGGEGADELRGGDGADHIVGGWGDSVSDTLYGGNGNDLMFGTDGNDFLYGEADEDWMDGGWQNDSMDGGTGSDRLVGSQGNDTVLGGDDADTLTGGAGSDTIQGGHGSDEIWGGRGDFIDGGETGTDSDILNVSDVASVSYSGAEDGTVFFNGGGSLTFQNIENVVILSNDYTVSGTASADSIGQFYFDADGDWIDNDDALGGGDQDSVLAGAGNDSIWAGTGNDTIDAGTGDDFVSADSEDDSILAGSGNDTVYGGWGNDFADLGDGDDVFGDWSSDDYGNDVVFGGNGNDSVIAKAGNDTVYGEAGSDTLSGAAGNDSLYGGDDADLFSISDDHDYDYIAGGEGGVDFDTLNLSNFATAQGVQVFFSGDEAGTYDYVDAAATGFGDFVEIEQIDGSIYDDFISASASTVFQDLYGDAGNDSLYGGSAGDSLDGGSGNDQIYGLGGNDTLRSGDGQDTVDGGAGDDYLIGSHTQPGDFSLLVGGAGNDTLDGTGAVWEIAGYYTSAAGVFVDLTDAFAESGGDAQGDVLLGIEQIDGSNNAADTIIGNAGVYEIKGNGGDDVLTLNTTDWGVAYGGDGADTITGGAGNDTLDGDDGFASGGADSISGGAGDDQIIGDVGADTLDGGAGNDTIYAGADYDTIIDSAGNDLIYGQDGKDRFDYTTITGDDTVVGGEVDDTTAFDSGDKLDAHWNTDDLAITFSGSEAGTLTDGTDTVTFSEIEHFMGGTGSDTIDARLSTTQQILDGGENADTIYSGQGDDIIALGLTQDFLATDGDNDLLVLADGFGDDSIEGFEVPTDLGGGSYAGNDQLDVSALTDAGGNPVNVDDVTVTDTNGDGSGDAILQFPNGESLTLWGVTVSQVNSDAQLIAMGIPPAGDFTVDGTAAGDLITSTYVDAQGDRVDNNDHSDGSNKDLIYGYDGDDIIQSGAESDTIYGGIGDDQLYGDGGNDSLFGEAGDDWLFSGLGDDTLFGGAGNDSIFASAGADSIDAGAGNDTIRYTQDDTVLGGDGDDYFRADNLQLDGSPVTLTGGEGAETGGDTVFSGTYFDDVTVNLTAAETGTMQLGTTTVSFSEMEWVQTGVGNDTINGAAGNDNVLAGAGDDSIEAAAGDDSILGEGGNDVIDGDLGNDTLIGGDGNDTLRGQQGHDSVLGGGGNDSIRVTDGNDTVDAGTGDDIVVVTEESGTSIVDGGTGNDTLDVSTVLETSGWTVTATGDGAGTASHGTGASFTYTDFETIQGSSNADLINVSADTNGAYAIGGEGDDTLIGGIGADNLRGRVGNDGIEGGAGNDTLDGGTGSDTITGGTGDDSISADEDADTILVQDSFGNDTIFGGEGVSTGTDFDSINLTAVTTGVVATFSGNEAGTITDGTDTITFAEIESLSLTDQADSLNGFSSSAPIEALGYGGDDNLRGGGGSDTLYGMDGNDTLLGGAGGDSLLGGAGNDVVMAESGDDTIYAGAGDDVVWHSNGSDLIYGEAGNDTLYGGGTAATGHDTIFGGSGNDSLAGVAGNDVLDGGDGDDTLDADAGNDSLTGGADSDTFIVTNNFGSDTIVGGETTTTGADFDTIDLSALTAAVVIDWTGAESGTITSGANTITFSEIEHIILTDQADTLDATAEVTPISVDGAGGDDSIVGGAAGDTLLGGDGRDTLRGETGDDSLVGGAGRDTLDGGAGADILDGGTDDDRFYVTGADTVIGGTGDDQATILDGFDGSVVDLGGDTITVDATAYGEQLDLWSLTSSVNLTFASGTGGTLISGAGETLTFSNVEEFVTALDQDLFLDARLADWDINVGDIGTNSTIYGSAYDDNISFGGSFAASSTGRFYDGGAGNDYLYSGRGDDTLLGGIGNDTLGGDLGNDSLYGGAGDDSIDGWHGADTLSGGAGNDILEGAHDGDTFLVEDGFGNDTIVGGETITTGVDFDTIDVSAVTTGVTVDWSGPEAGTIAAAGDTIAFSQIETITLGAGDDLLILSDGDGTYSVSGFEVPLDDGGEGHIGQDQLDVSGLTSDGGTTPVTVSDVTVTDDGSGNAVLTFPGGESLTLLGVSLAQVSDPTQLIAMGIPADPSDFTVSGDAGDNLIGLGYTGDDELDRIDNGDGVGGTNVDTVLAGAGNDTVSAGLANDSVDGGAGNDSLSGGSGNDTVLGNIGDDWLTGNSGDDTVDGGAGNDSVFGAEGNDSMLGGAGNDSMEGWIGADTIRGGDGNDYIDGANDNDLLFGDAGDDTILGGNNGGQDTLYGGAGNDSMLGGDGSDSFIGGTGADTILAAAGDDTIIVEDSFGSDLISGGETTETTGDRLDLTAVTQNVTVDLTAGNASNPEDGTIISGADTITFSEIETLQLGSGNDTLTGSTTADTAYMGAGDDSASGGTGNDTLWGDLGNDTLSGGADDDALWGGSNNDSLMGDAGNDTLRGGSDSDTLDGGDGNDLLIGNTGNDVLTVSAGNDTYVGGTGNDTITVGSGDIAQGDDGDDVFFARAADMNGSALNIVGGENAETAGDTLNITGPATINMTGAEAGTVTWLDGSVLTFSEIENVNYTACFTASTRITTDGGDKRAMAIKVGDLVKTRDHGLQAVRWKGHTHITSRQLLDTPDLQPVRIEPGALGQGLPMRPLVVSPQHRVMYSGARAELLFGQLEVLIAAKDLLGQPGVRRTVPKQGVTYVHFMCDEHQLVLSDGAWTESFQPGDLTLSGLDVEQRREIFRLFPELQSECGRDAYRAARMSLRSYQARMLLG